MTDREYLEFLNSLDENLIMYENFELKFNIFKKYKSMKRTHCKF